MVLQSTLVVAGFWWFLGVCLISMYIRHQCVMYFASRILPFMLHTNMNGFAMCNVDDSMWVNCGLRRYVHSSVLELLSFSLSMTVSCCFAMRILLSRPFDFDVVHEC